MTADIRGRYNTADNAIITGGLVEFLHGSREYDGLDLGGGVVDPSTGAYHWFYDVGWDPLRPANRPIDKTFAAAVYALTKPPVPNFVPPK